MLYSLFINLTELFSFFNVFKFLTVRTGLAMFTSMLIVFLVGNHFINFFSSKQLHNPIRKDGPEDHIIKKNWHSNNGRLTNIIRIIFRSFALG